MQTIEIINEAIENGAGKRKACSVLDISLRTFQRWEKDCCADKRKGSMKNIPRKLSAEEEQRAMDVACSKPFKDLTPYAIVAILAEQGQYIASERTFYVSA
jgi:transposase